ncbi:lipid kinase [Nocardioides litoris]|uniref:lipid kinase n=1 Tax=Nocardioides litoris TaxID=1926648 RepID=UPI0011227326|nr:lipid kinase [Nocardioides litoris]
MSSAETPDFVPPGPAPRLDDVALVVNGGSRKGLDAADLARDRLTAAGAGEVRLYAAPDGSRLLATLDEALASAPGMLVIGGGDGSVGAAAGRVAGTDTMLGVLPLGTANDFARTLEIPADLDGAVAALVDGRVVDIDLGRAGEHPYLNVASLGLSVATTQRLTPGMKKRLGPVAYPVAAARAYRDHVPFAARLEFPDGDHPTLEVADVLQVAVGNGRYYGGGMTVAPGAGIDDGTLDVYCIEKGRVRDHFSIARLFKTGKFVEHEKVHHAVTRAVRVVTDPAQPVNLDGEVLATTPLTFRLERNAVHVVVPTTSRAARWDG